MSDSVSPRRRAAPDDELGVYRSQGTGIRLHLPRYRLVFALVQTQGIVAVMCAAIAGVIGGLALSGVDPVASWIVGVVLFLATLVGLMAYWRRRSSKFAPASARCTRHPQSRSTS